MKTPQNIMFAPCGIDCSLCYAHLRDKKKCNGCLVNDESLPKSCRKCKIKLCAQEKNIDLCMNCEEFPCKLIKNIDRRYRKSYQISLIADSQRAKEVGIETFLKENRAKFTCPECSGPVSIHTKKCNDCGMILASDAE